ncbi:MAG: hypothetical protein PHC34_08750 [Candidatus Gastranaerophilales bacterium]|nr:hypothetical protein [Candidatus Gastranaerophilales bacterium]
MAEYFKNFEKQRTYSGNVQDDKNKPKKFVFQIYPENIDYIDSLPYEEKHDLINQLLTNYREGFYTEDNSKTGTQKLTNTVRNFILLIIIIPVLLYLLNVSLNVTKNNYRIFQGNFEKLFRY